MKLLISNVSLSYQLRGEANQRTSYSWLVSGVNKIGCQYLIIGCTIVVATMITHRVPRHLPPGPDGGLMLRKGTSLWCPTASGSEWERNSEVSPSAVWVFGLDVQCWTTALW